MACQRVFGTTELLEAILIYLPLPDLLRVQAVCSQWQRNIQKSSPLQENLFLKAAKQETVWLARVTNLPSGMGPLPRRYPADVQIVKAVPSNSEELQSHHGLVVSPVRINPLCLSRVSRSPDLDIAPEFVLDRNSNMGTPLILTKNIDELRRQPRQDGECWQNMLLTQPPVEYLTLEVGRIDMEETPNALFRRIRIHRRRSLGTVYKKIYVKGGVRMNDLVSAMHDSAEGVANASDPDKGPEPHAIYMHGAISVDDNDEQIVQERTKRRLDGDQEVSMWSLA